MQLTGPPRLAGILRRHAVAGGPVEDEWDDRSVVVRGRRRSRRKGPARLWPRWRFEVLVAAGQWLGWRSDLEGDADGEVDWCPRTRALGDPAWLPEHTYRARCTSPLPTLEELRLRAPDGRGLYAVAVELEGVAPLGERPDVVRGGFDLLGVTLDYAGFFVAPYGSATSRPVPFEVEFLGETYALSGYELGPDPVVAARTEPHVPSGPALGGTVEPLGAGVLVRVLDPAAWDPDFPLPTPNRPDLPPTEFEPK